MMPLASRTHRVTQADLDNWSALSGDHNPLHADPEFARTTRFGGTIAHGHLILTWLTGAAATVTGDPSLTGATIAELAFSAPVRPDHEYVVQVLRDGGAGGPARLEVHDQENGQAVASAVLTWADPATQQGA